MFKTILICSDGSADAVRAAKEGICLAKLHGATVVLLNVQACPEHEVTVPWQLEVGVTDATHHLSAQHRANLYLTVEMCRAEQIAYRCRHEFGHAAEQIIRIAKEENADLIVMGSRGLSEWKALLLGSVSDHVLHHAECSVLIVR